MRAKLMLAAGIAGMLILACLSLAIPGPGVHPANQERAVAVPPASQTPEPGGSQSGVSQPKSSMSQTPGNMTVLQSTQRDLYGDGNQEHVMLYLQNEDSWPRYLRLTVDGDEKVNLRLEDGYTSGELGFASLDGGRVGDVLLYQDCTGSCGAKLLEVYRPSRGVWQRIFAAPDDPQCYNIGPDNKRYTVKYLGDYQVSFADRQNGLQAVIELDRTTHQGMENLLGRISTWVDPIADYRFTVNGNGAQEIITVQRVIGVAHPDTIAELRTTYKLESGQYRPVSEALTTPADPVTGAVQVLSQVGLTGEPDLTSPWASYESIHPI